MVKKILLSVLVLAFSSAETFAQAKTCETPSDDPALDLNSITKCSIQESKDKKTSKKTKKVSVEVTSRRRVVRKRDAVTGLGGSSTSSHKFADLKKKASLVGKLDLNKEEVMDKIPFNLVEEVPLFTSCESVPIFQQEKCFKVEMAKHIKKHFRYPKEAYDKSIQGRVLTKFVIAEDGSVSDMIIKGPFQGELLEEEARRIVSKLPKFKPGKYNGKKVKVKYGVPISFKIPGKAASNIKKTNLKTAKLTNIMSFGEVNTIPLFKTCSSSGNKTSDCFNAELMKHVQKYFAYPEEAAKNNIEGKINTYFVVDKKGQVVNIKTKGPVGADILEAATKSLINKLPKFKPATKDGKPVNVKYVFPINFRLH